MDDGSEDDRTAEVARSFFPEQRFGRDHKKWRSCGGALRNRMPCSSYSQGDYIQWLDADDLLAPDKIERQLAVLRGIDNRRILLSSSWAYFHFRPHRARFIPNSLWQNLSPVEWLLRKMGENLHMQSGNLADESGIVPKPPGHGTRSC